MQLQCVCGYPLFLTAIWNQVEYYFAVRDSTPGTGTASRPAIIYCPQCSQALTLEVLAHHWATRLDKSPRPDTQPDTEHTD